MQQSSRLCFCFVKGHTQHGLIPSGFIGSEISNQYTEYIYSLHRGEGSTCDVDVVDGPLKISEWHGDELQEILGFEPWKVDFDSRIPISYLELPTPSERRFYFE